LVAIGVVASLVLALSDERCFTTPRSRAQHGQAVDAGEAPLPGVLPRRALVSAASAVLGLSGDSPARAVMTGSEHDVAERANQILKNLQDRWPEIEAKGAEGGKDVLEAFGNTVTLKFTVVVPDGQSLGVDVEDRTITNVNNRRMGWSVGDVISTVNGEEMKDEEELANAVKAAKKKGGPIKIQVSRLAESPWVSIGRALPKIYANADIDLPMPEADEVADSVQNLKNFATLAKDGFAEMSTLKAKLDKLIKVLDIYVSV